MRDKEEYLFFFQEEDGIRDIGVIGVQTCVFPIEQLKIPHGMLQYGRESVNECHSGHVPAEDESMPSSGRGLKIVKGGVRSEEGRVGKKCRSWLSTYH